MSYRAFISYRHRSGAHIAGAIETALQGYARRPLERPMRIFRDERHIAPGKSLSPTIHQALRTSEYLVLLASADAAASDWVKDELTIWCESRERVDRLIIVHVSDRLVIDPVTRRFDWGQIDALPSFLAHHIKDVPLYVDMTWATDAQALTLSNPRFQKAIVGISARIRGVEPDALVNQHLVLQRNAVRRRGIAILSLLALSLALTFAVLAAVNSKQEAQDQTVIAVQKLRESEVDNALARADLPQALSILQQLPASFDNARRATETLGLGIRWTLPQSEHTVFSWHQQGHLLAAGGRDGTLSLIEPGRGQIRSLHKVKASVVSIEWSPLGNWLLWLSADGRVGIVDTQTGEAVAACCEDDRVTVAVWLPTTGGGVPPVVLGMASGQVKYGRMEQLQALYEDDVPGSVSSLVVTKELMVAVGREDGRLTVARLFPNSDSTWDVVQGHRKMPEDRAVKALGWSAGGRRLFVHNRHPKSNGTTLAVYHFGKLPDSPGRTKAHDHFDVSSIDIDERNYSDYFTAVGWSPLEERLGYAVADRRIKVVTFKDDGKKDEKDLDKTDEIDGLALGGAIRHLAWSPDGNSLAGAAGDTVDFGYEWGVDNNLSISVWTIGRDHLESRAKLSGHASTVDALKWSPEGRYLVTAAADGTTMIWETSLAHVPPVWEGQATAMCHAPAGSEGHSIFVAEEGVLSLVKLSQGMLPLSRTLMSKKDPIGGLHCRPGKNEVAVLREGEVDLVSADGGPQRAIVTGNATFALASWSPDGSALAVSVGSANRDTIEGRVDSIFEAEFSFMASNRNSDERSVHIWREKTGVRRIDPWEKAHPVTAQYSGIATFDWCGLRLAFSGYTGGIGQPPTTIYYVEPDEPPKAFAVVDAPADLGSLMWHPSCALILARPRYRGGVFFIDPTVPRGETAAEANPICSPRGAAHWDPAGRYFSCGGVGGAVDIWGPDAGGRWHSTHLVGHSNVVSAMAWSPILTTSPLEAMTSSRLATGDVFGQVRVWDAGTQSSLVLQVRGEAIKDLSWSDDGELLGAIDESGHGRVWRIPDRSEDYSALLKHLVASARLDDGQR